MSMNELAAAMRSFVMTGFGEPLREYRAPRPEPTGSEVLLKVDACGVCHSDLHMWEGFFDLGQGRQLDLRPSIALPRALGHEIAGTVVAVGPDVRDARPGDRRVVFPWIGCGQCARCAAGEEHLCAAQRNLGTRRDGGFGSHVLVPHERYRSARVTRSSSSAPAASGCRRSASRAACTAWRRSWPRSTARSGTPRSPPVPRRCWTRATARP
jgi:D-arabinose 1-dehydrogenase-like Zn-dependent alcohol dehydrogenase